MTHHRGQQTKVEAARIVVARRVVADGSVQLKALSDIAGVSKPLMSTILGDLVAEEQLVEHDAGGNSKRWTRGPKFVPAPPRRATAAILRPHVGAGRR